MHLTLLVTALASQAAPLTAARVVSWQPKPGHERAFEEGYRRHLEWHRAHHDSWTWRGWLFISGTRAGSFIDGSFGHAWSDFDTPVDPAGDSADNEAHVEPHADVTQVMTFEQVAARGADCLASPLLTFAWLEVLAGESAPSLKREGAVCAVLLRPVTGSSEHLLLLGARKASELRLHADALDEVVRAANAERRKVAAVRVETARLRDDLTYKP